MADLARPDAALLDRLKAIVGASAWHAPDRAARYFDDPRGRFTGQACLVLMPANTDQVSQILRLCNQTGTGVIPWGGGTGVVAGQMAPDHANAVILSLERLNTLREIATADYAMVVEAGCVLENIHAAAAAQELMFPLSMASKGSCTIGGNLATNAGGIQVLRHGNARDLCLGIEAVLASGEILSELNPLRKNNTGYDLRHLLIGSEGTLGVITAATLVLKPIDAAQVTAFCALTSPAQACAAFDQLRRSLGDSLSGLELMSGFGIDLVTRHFPGLQRPFRDAHPWYLLVELSGPDGLRQRAEGALAEILAAGALSDVVIAANEAQRTNLWDLRENTPDANRAEGAICSSDTSVPISRVDDFIRETYIALHDVHPGLRTNSYGHIGDGNIHHNVFAPEGISKADFIAKTPGIIDAVRDAIDLVTLGLGGAISAEHGIGRLKVPDLQRYASPAKLDTLHQIKRALDPNGILNPGAVLG